MSLKNCNGSISCFGQKNVIGNDIMVLPIKDFQSQIMVYSSFATSLSNHGSSERETPSTCIPESERGRAEPTADHQWTHSMNQK